MKISKVFSILTTAAAIAAFVGCTNPAATSSVEEIAPVENVKGVEGPISKAASSPDAYENDDTPENAKFHDYNFNKKYVHNFYDDAVDYVTFSGYTINTYIIDTEIAEGSNADTVLRIYSDKECTNEVAYNDDVRGSFESQIIFTPTVNGTYYIKCTSWRGRTGADREYTLRVQKLAYAEKSTFSNSSNDGWSLYANLNGSVAHIDPANSSEMEIDIYEPGVNNWDIGLYKEGFEAARYYVNSVEIICAIKTEPGKTREVEVLLGQSTYPYTTYGSKTVTVHENYQVVRLNVPVGSITDSNAQVAFNLGGGTPMDIWIDDIVVIGLDSDLF